MLKKKIPGITALCKFATKGKRNKQLLIPFFKSLTSTIDRNIVLLGEIWPSNNYAKRFFKDPPEPEPLIKVIRKKFPQVEFYEVGNEECAELINQGLEILKEYDIVFIRGTDEFYTKKDWERLIDFIQKTDYDCYRINDSRRSINYYYDCDHGLKDSKDTDPIAVSPKKRFHGLVDYTGRTYIIDWDGFLLHHFKGFRGDMQELKKWIDGHGGKEFVQKYGDNGKWFKCPQEIRKLIEKHNA